MIIEEDFTSHKFTLKFETTGRRIELSRKESIKLEKRFQEIKNEMFIS